MSNELRNIVQKHYILLLKRDRGSWRQLGVEEGTHSLVVCLFFIKWLRFPFSVEKTFFFLKLASETVPNRQFSFPDMCRCNHITEISPYLLVDQHNNASFHGTVEHMEIQWHIWRNPNLDLNLKCQPIYLHVGENVPQMLAHVHMILLQW